MEGVLSSSLKAVVGPRLASDEAMYQCSLFEYSREGVENVAFYSEIRHLSFENGHDARLNGVIIAFTLQRYRRRYFHKSLQAFSNVQ